MNNENQEMFDKIAEDFYNGLLSNDMLKEIEENPDFIFLENQLFREALKNISNYQDKCELEQMIIDLIHLTKKISYKKGFKDGISGIIELKTNGI